MRARAHALDPFATQPEDLAGLGLGRYPDFRVAVEGRDFDLSAQSRRREADRHLTVQIIVVACEYAVRLDVDDDVKISRRPSVHAGFAFSRQPDAIPLVDTRWDFHRQRLVLLHAA